jgi:hypothetical protein
MYRAPDTRIGATTADIPGHGFVNISVGRFRDFGEQHGGAHDLSRLTITTLWHVNFDPCSLKRMAEVVRQTFYRPNMLAFNPGKWRNARANCFAIEMHCACATKRHPTTILGASETKRLAKDPEQRRRWVYIHLDGFPIQHKGSHAVSPSQTEILNDHNIANPPRQEVEGLGSGFVQRLRREDAEGEVTELAIRAEEVERSKNLHGFSQTTA